MAAHDKSKSAVLRTKIRCNLKVLGLKPVLVLATVKFPSLFLLVPSLLSVSRFSS